MAIYYLTIRKEKIIENNALFYSLFCYYVFIETKHPVSWNEKIKMTVSVFKNEDNNVAFDILPSEEGKIYRVSGKVKGQYFASEWLEYEDNAAEDAQEFYTFKVNSL